jgi:hypothetical protein
MYENTYVVVGSANNTTYYYAVKPRTRHLKPKNSKVQNTKYKIQNTKYKVEHSPRRPSIDLQIITRR